MIVSSWSHGMVLTRDRGTNCDRVSGISLRTDAMDVMQGNLAEGIGTAESYARIGTLLFNTGLIAWALAVYEAFGSTVGRRSYELGHTGAGRFIVDYGALGVWSTR